MYCAHCGHEIDDKAVICIHCGVAVNNLPLNTSVQPKEPKKVNGAAVASLVLGVCSIWFNGIMLLIGMFFTLIITYMHTWLFSFILCLALPVAGVVVSIIAMVKRKKYNTANSIAIAGLLVSIGSFLLWGSVCLSIILDSGFIFMR